MIYSIFEKMDMVYIYRNNLCCNVNSIKNKLLLKFEEKWFENVLLKPKLRTYMQIKDLNYMLHHVYREVKDL